MDTLNQTKLIEEFSKHIQTQNMIMNPMTLMSNPTAIFDWFIMSNIVEGVKKYQDKLGIILTISIFFILFKFKSFLNWCVEKITSFVQKPEFWKSIQTKFTSISVLIKKINFHRKPNIKEIISDKEQTNPNAIYVSMSFDSNDIACSLLTYLRNNGIYFSTNSYKINVSNKTEMLITRNLADVEFEIEPNIFIKLIGNYDFVTLDNKVNQIVQFNSDKIIPKQRIENNFMKQIIDDDMYQFIMDV